MSLNTKKILAASCALTLGFAASAFAGPSQDVVTNNKQPIRSERFGTCVLTKWNAESDICAPAKPAEVAKPAPAPAAEPVQALAREQLTILFPFNKSSLTKESTAKLDQIADAVNRSPKVTRVGIVGYTDVIGSDSYNNKLSEKRAQMAKKYLDSRMRLDSSIVGLRGLGKENPVSDCAKVTKRAAKIECMATDRRVEIEFEFQK
jgi:OOP family OmpA-OmpF porin